MARGCWGRNRGRLCPEFSGRIRGGGGGGGEELRKPLLQIVLQVAVDVVVVEFVESISFCLSVSVCFRFTPLFFF